MYRKLLAACLAIAVTTPVQARWMVAESDHFVIYADDREDDIARFVDQLERFHNAMKHMTGRDLPMPSPSNRVTIYAVGNDRDIRRLTGASQNVAGFYVPRAGGSSAFVPDVRVSSRQTDFTMTVLLHEYAHHFLISSSRHALPRWLGEGAAEFYASARFPKDGTVEIGRPAYHRAGELYFADEVPLEALFEYDHVDRRAESDRNDFYGRSWLLVHYLTLGGERPGQLAAYQQAVAGRKSPLDAAREVFGDLDDLRSELKSYLSQRRISMITLSGETLAAGPISIRELSPGMADAMPHIITSRSGVSREEALELLPKIRDVAAEYPDDAAVLAALAEAEFDAGNDAEAVAAADRALAIDPAEKKALVQKGYALFRQAAEYDGEDREAAYRAAMAPFNALNKLENDHPLPLIYYYRRFAEAGAEPTELARHALARASELAPFDMGLALNVGMMRARFGELAEARYALEPLAADPHNSGPARAARALLGVLEGMEEGTPLDGMRAAMAIAGDSIEIEPASAED